MIFETEISISVWLNPHLFASMVREFHPNKASSEENYN